MEVGEEEEGLGRRLTALLDKGEDARAGIDEDEEAGLPEIELKARRRAPVPGERRPVDGRRAAGSPADEGGAHPDRFPSHSAIRGAAAS